MIFPVISWRSSSYVEGSGEPEDYIYNYSGPIQDVKDSGRSITIGKFRAYYVDVARSINEGISVFDVLDAYSHTHEYHEDIFGNNCPGFSDGVEELLEFEIDGSNLLILDRLELLPKYRGSRLGLKVMLHMITRFSPGAGVVAIKPFPLQMENSKDDAWRLKLKLDDFPKEEASSKIALNRYYEKLGFLGLPNSPFMVLSTSMKLPGLEEI